MVAERKDRYGFKADGVISKSGGGFRDDAVTNEEGMMSEVTASAGAERAAGGAELSADQAHSLYRDGFVRVASQPPPPALALTPAVVLAGRPQGPHPEGDLERRAAAADDAARRRAAGRLRL